MVALSLLSNDRDCFHYESCARIAMLATDEEVLQDRVPMCLVERDFREDQEAVGQKSLPAPAIACAFL